MLNECGQHNDQHVQLICYNTHTHIYTRKKTDNYFPFPIGSCVNVGNSTEIMSINKQHEQQPSNRHGHMIQYWLDKLPSFNHSINRHCWPHNIDNTLVNQWKIVALAPAQLASLRCFFNIYPSISHQNNDDDIFILSIWFDLIWFDSIGKIQKKMFRIQITNKQHNFLDFKEKVDFKEKKIRSSVCVEWWMNEMWKKAYHLKNS